MAIASRHQWVQVFKPLLVLALENFFSTPVENVLANLFNSINTMDLSRMPRLSIVERRIIRAFEDKSPYEDRFIQESSQKGNIGLSYDPLHPQNYIAPPNSVPSRFVTSALKNRQSVFGSSKSHKDKQFFETKVEYDGVKVPIRIPLTIYPEEIGDFSIIKLVTTFSAPNTFVHPNPNAVDGNIGGNLTSQLKWRNAAPYWWHPHLDTGPNTPPLVVLLNGILTNKRIIFLGHGRPSGEVANFVLAACAFASGGGTVLNGFADRCFPYVGLTGLDELLSVSGFIAGVTNPVFEEQFSWWDILCNINTGRITISHRIEQPHSNFSDNASPALRPLSHGGWEGDADIVGDVVSSINSHIGEIYIRQKLYDHVQRIIEVAGAIEADIANSQGNPIEEFGNSAYFVDAQAKKREIFFLKNRVE
ncbi:hypothetical protein HK096_009681, partial [Nowakowskiella sp. JEL0078]